MKKWDEHVNDLIKPQTMSPLSFKFPFVVLVCAIHILKKLMNGLELPKQTTNVSANENSPNNSSLMVNHDSVLTTRRHG